MNTTPAASATWTTDIGASASAATCRPQLAVAMIMPSANHFEENSAAAERSGWRGPDLRHRVGAPVLVEEGEVRDERAGEGEQYAGC